MDPENVNKLLENCGVTSSAYVSTTFNIVIRVIKRIIVQLII